MRLFPRLRRHVARVLCPEVTTLEERVSKLEALASSAGTAMRESLARSASYDAKISDFFLDPASRRREGSE